MSDDDSTDDTLDALRFFLQSGTVHSGGEEYNVTGGDVTIDTSGVEPKDAPEGIPFDEEFEGSFTIGLDGDDCETVVCPGCNTANVLPPAPFLQSLSRGPAPCVECGYPLL